MCMLYPYHHPTWLQNALVDKVDNLIDEMKADPEKVKVSFSTIVV